MSALRLLLSCILAFVLLPLLAFSEPNNEVISKRTRTAKTFLNAGGTYTTHVHLRPIHEKDPSGNWVDIVRNAPGAAKAANYNERQVDPGFFCVGRDGDGVYAWADWDNGGLFGDDNNNIVGYLQDRPSEPFRTYRQVFRWHNFSFFTAYETIIITDMYYKFNNVSSTTNPDTLAIASVTGSDPSGWSASSIWNNGTREPFVFVHVTGYVQDGAKAYTVDLTDDISTLEDRANIPPISATETRCGMPRTIV